MNRNEPMLPENDVRETPHQLFSDLNKLHGPFTLDACASHENAKCLTYFTETGMWGRSVHDPRPVQLSKEDGLSGTWTGRVWCNPPYSDIGAWVLKAWESQAERVCMLVPATRTEQAWWQEAVEPYRDAEIVFGGLPGGWWDSLKVDFLPGRQHFLEDGHPIWRKNKDGTLWLNKKGQPVRSSPKFGVCTLTWRH